MNHEIPPLPDRYRNLERTALKCGLGFLVVIVLLAVLSSIV